MKWFSLPAALTVLALSVPAHADLLGRLDSAMRQDTELSAPTVVGVGSADDANTDAVVVDRMFTSTINKGAPVYGYPFVSGCCEQRASCCDHLWHGYDGGRHCGGCRGWFHRRCAPRCHKNPCPYGCGHYPYHGCRPVHHRRLGCKLGLWDWHRAHVGCHKCRKAYYPQPHGCGCGYGCGYGYGYGYGYDMGYPGTKIMGEGEVDSHVVPEPAPVPESAEGNSAHRELPRRLRMYPARLRRGVEADGELRPYAAG